MEGGNDVFVINTEEEKMEEVSVAQTEENAKETLAEAMGDVKGLVPLCTQHVHGPQLSSATFGYDIAQMAKRPWAEPGAKLSDYFNYGFNEQSWRVYCAMQKGGEASLLAKATEMLQKLEAAGRPSTEPNTAINAGGMEEGGVADPSMGGMYGMTEVYGGNPYINNNNNNGSGGYGGGYNNGNNRLYYQRDYNNNTYGGFVGGAHNMNYKTRLCKSYAEGHCNRGESCNYAHGVAELRQPGGASNVTTGQQQQQQQQQQQMSGTMNPAVQQQQGGQDYGSAAAFYSAGSAPPPPERAANYLMPPFQPAGNMPPMMMQSNTIQPPPQLEGGEGVSGFRQPPKRQRHEGGGVYEPQY